MADDGTATDFGHMTLVEHLTELRKRLIISVIAVVVCGVVVFILYYRILAFLSEPYEKVTIGQEGCGGTATTGCKLIVTGPLEPFTIRLKIAGYGGLALAIPIVFWQIWRFVTPGLHKHERRYAIGFFVSAILLFLMGAFVSWLTVDKALEFLFGVGGDNLQVFITAEKYLTLVILLIIAFGISFEFPLLLVFLLMVRIVSTRQLRQARRWAAVGIVIFAAVITPSQDPFSLLFMAVPMYIFYEIPIIVGRLMKR
jgi:sec-independent protein translocase protein TatC